MAAAHDLAQDLEISHEELHQMRKDDPKLDDLVADYESVDKRTVDAETTNSVIIPDEELTAMKEERLKIKDEIMRRVNKA